MKLQFDPNQSYQLDAVAAAVDLFKGQPKLSHAPALSAARAVGGTFLSVIANNLLLDEEALLKNLQAVQQRHSLESSARLEECHFSIEMETGTGKTYVYLRTIHELYKIYGFKKFIIVVPSLAIKEGVLKNLEITKEHFQVIYENPCQNSYEFNPRQRNLSRDFATADSLQIMVMNIDQFSRANPQSEDKKKKSINIFYQRSDWGIPAEFIKATRPIVIVDEPQNMETEIRRAALAKLNPLCTLRYSATHTVKYHQIYRLGPVRAYDLGLVKKIEVDGITEAENFNQAFIELKSIAPQKNKITAKLKIDVNLKDGVGQKEIRVSIGANLFEASNRREVYKDGYIVAEIDREKLRFNNGQVLRLGQKQGGLTDEIMRYQMENTLKNHFEKEARLKPKGIKVLSLFFIDRVANYRSYEGEQPVKGKLARWFEEIYESLRRQEEYRGLLEFPVAAVHNGYFAADKKGNWKDSSEGRDTQDDDSAYQLIMRDKERLLDNAVPLRFIFSHSALREGWDNPNVFQICTLNETQSTLKKRQEIGRGLRLPVDSAGQRIMDSSINVLTVSANQHYEEFAAQLQAEIEEECGVRFDGGRIKDKHKKKPIKLTKNLHLDPEFAALWDKIKQKTRYRIEYETTELIRRAAARVKDITISRAKLIRSQAGIAMNGKAVTAELKSQAGREVNQQRQGIPDILAYIQGKTRLTRDTICRILLDSGRIEDVFINPQQFMDKVAAEINLVLQEMMIEGVKYEKMAGEFWDQRLFESKELMAYLDDLHKVKDKSKTIYDYVEIDSDIERRFAEECERRDDIKFYFKLPFWFKIATPLGTYNPDWAFVYKHDKKVYFVAETKGTNNLNDPALSDEERFKIKCGKKHFAEFADVEFKGPVRNLNDALLG